MRAALSRPELIREKSAPIAPLFAEAGATVFDLLWLGVTPVALECNEEWQAVLALACEKAGYTWEWVPIESCYPRMGEAVLVKVG